VIHPDTVRIVLSGFSELDTIIQAVNQGAIYKFLVKPWDDDQLREHIRDAFRYFESVLAPRALRPART
jgi:DNA-binding NtrC family response regulator